FVPGDVEIGADVVHAAFERQVRALGVEELMTDSRADRIAPLDVAELVLFGGPDRIAVPARTNEQVVLPAQQRLVPGEIAGVLAAVEDARERPAVALLARDRLALDAQIVGAAVAASAVAADVDASFPAHAEQIDARTGVDVGDRVDRDRRGLGTRLV